MSPKRCHRKPDLFSVLVLLVSIGMAVTLAYQVNVYYGADELPLAERGSNPRSVGG